MHHEHVICFSLSRTCVYRFDKEATMTKLWHAAPIFSGKDHSHNAKPLGHTKSFIQ